MVNKQNAQLSDVVIRRNDLLERFFRECDVPVRIIGDPQKPVVVYAETAILSMYVSNFDLHFLLSPDGVELARVKLRKHHGFTNQKLMDIILKAEHKAVIKIRLKNSDLCLAGYNFLDRAESEGRYPVFARYGHKVYFSKKYVDELVHELKAENYGVGIWVPALDDQMQQLKIKLYGE